MLTFKIKILSITKANTKMIAYQIFLFVSIFFHFRLFLFIHRKYICYSTCKTEIWCNKEERLHTMLSTLLRYILEGVVVTSQETTGSTYGYDRCRSSFFLTFFILVYPVKECDATSQSTRWIQRIFYSTIIANMEITIENTK